MHNQTEFVIGSTGKTGSRVAGKLADLGYTVRHGARRSSTPFDWEKPDTWHAALAGVQAVYITYFPDMAHPGAEENIEALTEAAGEVIEPIIDVEDIADVAFAALTEDGRNGQLYEITGPRLMSFDAALRRWLYGLV